MHCYCCPPSWSPSLLPGVFVFVLQGVLFLIYYHSRRSERAAEVDVTGR